MKVVETLGLMKRSWYFVKKDKEIIVLTILSILLSLAVIAASGFIVATCNILPERVMQATEDRLEFYRAFFSMTPLEHLKFFGWMGGSMFCFHFVNIFFLSAIVSIVILRIYGQSPTIFDGIAETLSKLHLLLAWTGFLTTILLVLKILGSRTRSWLAGGALGALEVACTFFSFFVVPIILVSGLGPIAAFKESATLVKRRWGNQVTASFSFSLLWMLILFFGMLLTISLHASGHLVLAALVVSLTATSICLILATEYAFCAVLYVYAAEDRVPDGFSASMLDRAVRHD